MAGRRLLVGVSAVQLGAGVAGHLIALREGRVLDLVWVGWRGRPDRMARDSWVLGTGLSAPTVMLAAQAVATARLAVAPSLAATRVIGTLGAMMSVGYLIERECWSAVTASSRQPVRASVVTLGFTLSVVLMLLGLGPGRSEGLRAATRRQRAQGGLLLRSIGPSGHDRPARGRAGRRRR